MSCNDALSDDRLSQHLINQCNATTAVGTQVPVLVPLWVPCFEMSKNPSTSCNVGMLALESWCRLNWIEQGLTFHQTHYRSYRGREAGVDSAVPLPAVFGDG